MRALLLSLSLALAGTTPILAQENHPDLFKSPNDVKWGPAPPSLPAGAQMAVLSGDPTKSGPYVVRIKLPANSQIAAHHHPTAENVTVISGNFHAGMGDKLDESHGFDLAPGAFASMPANMNHYVWASSESVVQVHGQGPFRIEYVNPADDPSKKK